MNKKIITGLLLSGALSFSAVAQQVEMSERKYDVVYEKADDLFINDKFAEAIKYLEQLNKSTKNSAEIEYKLGVCYLLSAEHNELARTHLIKANEQGYKTDEEPVLDYDEYHNDYISEDIDYCLARAYQLHLEFDKAIEHYNLFKEKYDTFYKRKHKQQVRELAMVDYYIQTANNGKELIKKPVAGVKIENLGDYVNSESEDIAPLITADEKTLIFTSRRKGSTGAKLDYEGRFMEDIYISRKDINGKWKKAQKLSTKINTAEHDAAVGLSPDGKKLILYKNNHHGTGDLYYSLVEGYAWSFPKKLGETINTKHLENSASISADKKTIYFVSNRPKGFGGQDIYMAKKQPDGTWGEAVNLGENINSPYDEDAPFIHADGTHLYFSSKGHNSMGGYDIFRTEYNATTNTWSKPENMGHPINTPDNDVFFVWSPDGKRAYFSSHHEDSYGDQDLYMMTLPNENRAVIVLKGHITSELSGEFLDAEIHIKDNDTGEEVSVLHSNGITGEYTLVLPADGHYSIDVKSEGFLPQNQVFDLPKKDEYYEKEIDFKLNRKKDESVVELEKLFFANNKADLNEAAHAELDKFVEILKQDPTIHAEVAGHTETGGIESNNQSLSQKRAEAVAKYLTEQGISKRRIKAVGYGSHFPKTKGLTQAEKQANRRTEIIIHHTDTEGKNWKPYYHR
ncbi:MAG: OmpA family protein [Cytophagales bacterium]|nr:OmpA family protein [Cytophagales bacterium]